MIHPALHRTARLSFAPALVLAAVLARPAAGTPPVGKPSADKPPASPSPAAELTVLQAVPDDCIVAYVARPYPEWIQSGGPRSAANQPSDEAAPGAQLTALIGLLNASGLMPDEGQVFADIAGRLPLLGKYEHALVLLDVSSRLVPKESKEGQDPDISLRLEQLQAAAVFKTDGSDQELMRHLNHVVGRYTNQDVAKLTSEKIEQWTYHRLVDERVRAWAVCEWGQIGGYYVLAFGEGAFKRIVHAYSGKHRRLSQDPWFQNAAKSSDSGQVSARCFVSFARLGQRLGEAAGGRLSQVMGAIGADEMTHDLWTIGRRGRALTWHRCYRRGDKDTVCLYSDPDSDPHALARLVPKKARNYAVLQLPTRWLVDNLPKAWLAARSESYRQTFLAAWQHLKDETGIDIGGNLIEHLGENVVVFDYPPHPLRIPLALTVAIEIDDRRAVQTAVDALLSAWRRHLDNRAERKGTTLVRLYVKQADDDVWFLQAGVLGPALKVTDRFVVISWSPQALREALPAFEGASKKK